MATTTRCILVMRCSHRRVKGALPSACEHLLSLQAYQPAQRLGRESRRALSLSACPPVRPVRLVPRRRDHWIDLSAGGAPARSSLKLPEAQILGSASQAPMLHLDLHGFSSWAAQGFPRARTTWAMLDLGPAPFPSLLQLLQLLVPPTELTRPALPASPAPLLK